ncbi:efflux RND transporter periplasmic adaptor subunit [Granulicella sp. dw_53]|uniref:efflux RND transporter periplasmic adaptor subunit n=1 Tax=Granulicella sp. dw_53 TaxID=2719792 RepID=UPI001BD6AC6B|nr:efflux RND transporter periplasmic adaptor subunit [Granulicella sp. dw_53]
MSMRSHSIVFRGALCIALPCFVFSGCKDKQPDSAPIATASVAPVTRGDLASTLTVAGEFQPYQEVELHAKVSGYIRRINVDIGDRVKNGQVIATLEVPELSAQVAGSQAEVRHSQSKIARAQSGVSLAEANYTAVHAAYIRLFAASKQRPGLVAEQELDDARARDLDAQAKISVAKSTLEATKEQLGVSQADNQRIQSLKDYSVVTAPFAGVITMRYADVGSLIQAGTTSNTQSMPVVKLAQSDLLRLRMPVPEEDVPFIKIGGDVSIKLQATGKTFAGKIIRFTRELSTSTRTMLAEVDVPNPDLALSTGMTAQTTIVLQAQKNVLTVPAGAVVKGDGQSSVLAVDADSKVQKVLVTLGIQSPGRIEVMQGLSEHQSVIVSGQTNYQPGQIVHPQLSTISMSKQGDNQ